MRHHGLAFTVWCGSDWRYGDLGLQTVLRYVKWQQYLTLCALLLLTSLFGEMQVVQLASSPLGLLEAVTLAEQVADSVRQHGCVIHECDHCVFGTT